MPHKIRHAVREMDSRYLPAGIMETDEIYIGGPKEGGKRGRGTDKSPVQAALSPDGRAHPQFVKTEILDDATGRSIRDFTVPHVKEGAVIKTDNCRSYAKAHEGRSYTHEPGAFDAKENPEHLKWLRRVAGNLKYTGNISRAMEKTFTGVS
jgi:hypothetical protein